jgi:hypothetical protein
MWHPRTNHDHKADASTDTAQVNKGRDWLPGWINGIKSLPVT